MKKAALFFILLTYSISTIQAQAFLKSKTGNKQSLKEIQLQFDEWAKHTDLKKTKGWKYYKRWEADMVMHTDGKGEPGDPSAYIDAAIRVANEKNANHSEKFLRSSWSPLGPFDLPANLVSYSPNGMGRVNCIAFSTTDTNTYFIGVGQGGVWKTSNNGASWTPITDNLPIERISDITIDPNNANVMYISVCDYEYLDWGLHYDGKKRNTHFGLGIYKTSDGGLTWNPTGLSFQLADGEASLIKKVLINPANSNQLVACGVSGMYTSADAGTTWTHTLDSLFWDMVQDPSNPNILYAATGWLVYANIGTAGIYKSIDFGNTWTLLNTGIPPTGSVQRIKLAIAPSDGNYIYAACVDNQAGCYGIYKTTDAGATWTFNYPGTNLFDGGTGTAAGGQATYTLLATVNAADKNILYVGAVNMWASTDGAVTFNPVMYWTSAYGPSLHCDFHNMTTQPGTSNIFVCGDGGLYKTSNIIPQTWAAATGGTPWPTIWTDLTNGMNISSFYRISSSKSTDGRIMAGAQDNSTFYYDGTSWSTIIGGDGMDNYLDPINTNKLIGSSQYGYFRYSVNGGVTSTTMNNNPLGEPGEWTTPLTADYNHPGTIYSGFVNVTKSTNGGINWTPLTLLPTNPLQAK